MGSEAWDERFGCGDAFLNEDIIDIDVMGSVPPDAPGFDAADAAEAAEADGGKEVFHGREGKADYRDYLKKLENDEEFYAMTVREQSEVLGVTSLTIRKWEKMVNWKDLALKFDDMYWKVKPLIMTALYRKAIKGDTKAIELSFQKGEGWFARSGMEVNVNRKFDEVADADLLKEAIKSLPLEEKKNLLGIRDEDVL